MRLQGSLACLLLALCLGGGEAGPLLRGGEEVGAEVGQAMGHGMGDAIGQGLGDAISHGVEEAVGQGTGGAAGSASRQAMSRSMEEAAQGLGNLGDEAGRQAENTIRLGGDAAHSSGQAMPGGSGAWVSGRKPRVEAGGCGHLGWVLEWAGGMTHGQEGLLPVAVWGGVPPRYASSLPHLGVSLRPPLPLSCLPVTRGTVTRTECGHVALAGNQRPASIWRPWHLWCPRWLRRPQPG